jgi:sulfate adenylyltransferase
MKHIHKTAELIPPYGGRLVNLLAEAEEREELARRAGEGPSLQLPPRILFDLELLATGAFSPLDRFMGKADYRRVLEEMRLAGGMLFPVPVTLPLAERDGIREGQEIALRNANNNLMAWMRVDELYEAPIPEEARKVLGPYYEEHVTYREMHASRANFRASGPLKVLVLPKYFDFPDLRRTPAQVRELLSGMGNPNVLAYTTHGPMHRGHEELTRRMAEEFASTLLLHPVVGIGNAGDVDHYTRVRIYKTLAENYYDHDATLLSLLPLAMRLAGPREALWQAIVRRNFGANRLIVGLEHCGPGKNSKGADFYDSREAQALVERLSAEIGVEIVPYDDMVYLPDEDRYERPSAVPLTTRVLSLSENQVHNDYLDKGRSLPHWFTRPETAGILGEAYPPRHKQGFCVWFTGLPSSGKTTIADLLTVALMEHGRQVTVLDGDVVRTHLSKGLGFSKEDRDTNILRIGFVASEIVRHNGVAIGAAVSPYRLTRDRVRALMRKDAFIETYVDTPVEICEQRDVKGMYAKARAGQIKCFTGVDDPYEPPLAPELVLHTGNGETPAENVERIIRYLTERGFLHEWAKVEADADAALAAAQS